MSRRLPADLQLASKILLEAREELGRADGKAGLLLATSGVVIGVVLGAVLAGDWDPRNLSNWVEWAWWCGTACSLYGPVAFSRAVWPRRSYLKFRPDGIVSFFGDVVGTRHEDLEERLWITALRPNTAVLDQLRQVSGIVDRKYEQIQIGLSSLGAGFGTCLLAVSLNNFL